MKAFGNNYPRPNVVSRRFIKDSRRTLKRLQKFIDNEEERQNKNQEAPEVVEPDVITERVPSKPE